MKNYLFSFIVIALFFNACSSEVTSDKTINADALNFNQALADRLIKMGAIDQVAAFPQGEYRTWPAERWDSFQDSIFSLQQIVVDSIFRIHGFPGYDLVGEEGSESFWLMVQHSDKHPGFQKEVLEKMKIEVEKKNANTEYFAMLTDRVQLNTGQKQIYGTQVKYNNKLCQAYPKPLMDSSRVNERRLSIGLPRLEKDLNAMSEGHFLMNKKNYEERGINGPTLYKE